jgi:hypothetical protein
MAIWSSILRAVQARRPMSQSNGGGGGSPWETRFALTQAPLRESECDHVRSLPGIEIGQAHLACRRPVWLPKQRGEHADRLAGLAVEQRRRLHAAIAGLGGDVSVRGVVRMGVHVLDEDASARPQCQTAGRRVARIHRFETVKEFLIHTSMHDGLRCSGRVARVRDRPPSRSCRERRPTRNRPAGGGTR